MDTSALWMLLLLLMMMLLLLMMMMLLPGEGGCLAGVGGLPPLCRLMRVTPPRG